jgi:hypothetical protein
VVKVSLAGMALREAAPTGPPAQGCQECPITQEEVEKGWALKTRDGGSELLEPALCDLVALSKWLVTQGDTSVVDEVFAVAKTACVVCSIAAAFGFADAALAARDCPALGASVSRDTSVVDEVFAVEETARAARLLQSGRAGSPPVATQAARAGTLLRGAAIFLMNRLSRDACLLPPPVVRAAGPRPKDCANDECTEVYTLDALRADSLLTRGDWVGRWHAPGRDALMRTPATAQFYRDFFRQPFWSSAEGEGPDAQLRAVGYVVVVASKGEDGKVNLLHPGHLVVVVEEPTLNSDLSAADTPQRNVWSIGFFPTGEKTGVRGQAGVLQFPDPMFEAWVADGPTAMAEAAEAAGRDPVRIVGAFRPTRQDAAFFRSVVDGAQAAAEAMGEELEEEWPSRLELAATRWAMFAGVMGSLQRGLEALGLQEPVENCATMFASRFGVDCPQGAPFLCKSRALSGFGDTFSELLLSTEQQLNDSVVKRDLRDAKQALASALVNARGGEGLA